MEIQKTLQVKVPAILKSYDQRDSYMERPGDMTVTYDYKHPTYLDFRQSSAFKIKIEVLKELIKEVESNG